MLKFGEIYNWSNIIKEYPNMYAIITDINKKDGVIQRCKLIDVVPFEKEEETVCHYIDTCMDFDCVRTTFSAPTVGVIL